MPEYRADVFEQHARIRRQRVDKIDHYPADAGGMAGQRKLTKQLGDVDPKRGGLHVISIADTGYRAKSASRQVSIAPSPFWRKFAQRQISAAGSSAEWSFRRASLLCSVEACNTQASSA